MSFLEIKLPVELSKKAVGGPSFRTNIVEMVSGKEQRNIDWQNTRARYVISAKSLAPAEIKKLLEFFYSCRGRAYGFRMRDWLDFEARAQVIGTGDGSHTEFSLCKNYNSGFNQFSRNINKPVSGSVKIYLDGVLANSGYNIDHTNGKVVFTTAPAAGEQVTADFEFDVAVRFASDELKLSADSILSSSVKDIELVEVKI